MQIRIVVVVINVEVVMSKRMVSESQPKASKGKRSSVRTAAAILNTQYPSQKGCCENTNWVNGFLMNYCKNCGANDF
jgi:hypothetical protein